MDQDRFSKKRHSLIGGGLAKFEGAEAADQFARRQSSYHTKVRQSIPDIRFDNHGMPISTRQLQARSHSLAGGSLFPADRRYSGDGLRRGSDFIPVGWEKNVRKLSKKFSCGDDEELKANFTIPENTRTGMFGTNRRWSVKPEWMKKRKSSVKEEFIEKNLSNLTLLSPASPKAQEEMSSISEELAPSSDEKITLVSDKVDNGDDPDGKMDNDDSSSCSETDSSYEEECSDSDKEQSDNDENIAEAESESKQDDVKEIKKEVDDNGEIVDNENHDEVMVLNNAEVKTLEKPLKSRKKRRKSKKNKKSATNGDLPPRPPPPPLAVQMCDITLFQEEESRSSDDDDDTIRTQYGKQKIFVSNCYHIFETSNGPLNESRD